MLNNPIYDEIIIVGVIYNNTFNWYIANKLLWIMDLEKLSQDDYKNYFENKEINKVREKIIILSEENIELFLDRIEKYKVNINQLRVSILDKIKEQDEDSELEEYYPVLMLDFDKNILYSQYPEPFGFENYVPNNWEGKYTSFIDYINDADKYWIYKNRNLLI